MKGESKDYFVVRTSLVLCRHSLVHRRSDLVLVAGESIILLPEP
jgi:hypothetical protein